jgi:copper(I)-binding protein
VIEPDRLVGLSTPLADGAEAGGDDAGAALNILIPRGKRTEFTEAGVHVRLVRLKLPMEMGREYPMTLDFARAGRLQATFLVDYAASA